MLLFSIKSCGLKFNLGYFVKTNAGLVFEQLYVASCHLHSPSKPQQFFQNFIKLGAN